MSMVKLWGKFSHYGAARKWRGGRPYLLYILVAGILPVLVLEVRARSGTVRLVEQFWRLFFFKLRHRSLLFILILIVGFIGILVWAGSYIGEHD